MSFRRGVLLLALSACSGEPAADGPTGTTRAAIENGSPATAFPEAVVVTASGFLPCSGVVLAPRVVLTAGHCRSATKKYSVSAPNANHQTASGSNDWTTFDGEAATSSDTLLIFLESDIKLDVYPTIAASEVAAGTPVVDVGRTLNNVITTSVYVSPTVTIEGTGDSLGFHYNYQALPDISQDGDSGGPIELVNGAAHSVVAIVDTDTVEQNITETTPIDLFARLDLVRDAMLQQISAHPSDAGSSADAGAKKSDAAGPLLDASASGTGKDAESEPADAGHDDATARRTAADGSCAIGPGAGVRDMWPIAFAFVLLSRRRRRMTEA
jgi:hypothetical protein